MKKNLVAIDCVKEMVCIPIHTYTYTYAYCYIIYIERFLL